MDIQLIAMDLDGTALLNDHHSFSPRLTAALLEAHRRGIAIAPVTGRQFILLPPPLLAHPAWGNLAVLCNGAEVRSLVNGQLLSSHYMCSETLLPLLEIADRFALPIEFSAGGTLYLTQADWNRQQSMAHLAFHKTVLARRGHAVANLKTFCLSSDLEFEKVNLPWIPQEARPEVEDALSCHSLSCVWSSPQSMEITHPEATKAGGMLQVCRLLGIDPKHTLALGDSGNDCSMLQAAGLGIAMGNAPPEVQRMAHAVTKSNMEDGAAIAIEQYALH